MTWAPTTSNYCMLCVSHACTDLSHPVEPQSPEPTEPPEPHTESQAERAAKPPADNIQSSMSAL